MSPIKPKAPDSSLPLYAGIIVWAWSLLLVFLFFQKARAEIGPNEFGILLGQWLRHPFPPVPNLDALTRHAKHLGFLAGISAVLVATGHRLLRASKIIPHNRWEKLTLAFSLGYGAWGTMLFIAGLAGLWSRTILLVALISALIPASIYLLILFYRSAPFPEETHTPLTRFDVIFTILFMIVWLGILGYALIPETFYDALAYHLSLPNLYLLNSAIIPTPENSYAGTPGLPWMLYGWTLVVDSWGITASLLHHSIIVWVAIGCIGICKRIDRSEAGFFSATAFFLTPVVIGESFRVSVNMEWAMLELCFLTTLIATMGKAAKTTDRRRWLVLCGIFLGLTMSTKYPAWLLPIALIPAMLMNAPISKQSAASNDPARLSLRESVVILAIATACVAPWILKNVYFYKNPIYPFFHEVFAPGIPHTPNWRQINPVGTNVQDLLSFPGLVSHLTFPLRFLTPPQGITLSIGLFGLCMTPLLAWARLSFNERLLGWFCASVLIPLSFISGETRFFIPHILPLVVLACCVLVRIEPTWMRNAFLTQSGMLIFAVGAGWLILCSYEPRWEIFRGRTDYSQYLGHSAESYPTPPYPAIEYVNASTPIGSRILLYGDARGFYLRRPYLAASNDQTSPLEAWADECSSGEALKYRLDNEGIKFIVINFGELSRLRALPKTSAKGLRTLNAFWKTYTLRVFGVQQPGDRWVAVYRILSADEAVQPHPVDNVFQVFVDRQQISQ